MANKFYGLLLVVLDCQGNNVCWISIYGWFVPF